MEEGFFDEDDEVFMSESDHEAEADDVYDENEKNGTSVTSTTVVSILKNREERNQEEKRKRNVTFGDDVKQHDGLLPLHGVLDKLIHSFFNCKIRTISDLLDHVRPRHMHLLSPCHGLIVDVIRRSKLSPEKNVHILPHGGGRGLMVAFPLHYNALRQLKAIVRTTHNLLHRFADVAIERGISEEEATPFILRNIRLHDQRLRYEAELRYQENMRQERERRMFNELNAEPPRRKEGIRTC